MTAVSPEATRDLELQEGNRSPSHTKNACRKISWFLRSKQGFIRALIPTQNTMATIRLLIWAPHVC